MLRALLCLVLAFAVGCGKSKPTGDDSVDEPETSGGTRLVFNGGNLYFTAPVTEEEAKRLGEYLVKHKAFDGTPKTVQLTREGATYQFHVILKKGIAVDQQRINSFRELARNYSRDVFGGEPVEIHICDHQMKTQRVIPQRQ